MKILHLTITQLAGAPLNLSNIINKYTEHESRVILKDFFRSRTVKDLRWDYPLVRLPEKEVRRQVAWADVVLLHQRPWRFPIHKPHGIMYHAQPGAYRPGRTHAQLNGKKLVIAQYHARFYRDAEVVPNMIDIWAPEYQPAPKKKNRIVIFMGVASETRTGWGNKNSEGVRKVFRKIEAKYPSQVEIRFLKGRPMKEVFEAKREADIVVDECQTGSYHLSSLEGCSYQAAVLNNIDTDCVQAIEKVTGQSTHPFLKTDMEGLYNRLEHLVTHPEELRTLQKNSRAWIEKHWDPRDKVQQFIRFFEKLKSQRSPG